MKYYMETGITETGLTGVGTRDAETSEFSNLKTGTLETGITGGFPVFWNVFEGFMRVFEVFCGFFVMVSSSGN
jgi:hypothetical protein